MNNLFIGYPRECEECGRTIYNGGDQKNHGFGRCKKPINWWKELCGKFFGKPTWPSTNTEVRTEDEAQD
jgi:hypothetical protein